MDQIDTCILNKGEEQLEDDKPCKMDDKENNECKAYNWSSSTSTR